MKRFSLPTLSIILFIAFMVAGVWMWRIWFSSSAGSVSSLDRTRIKFVSDQVKIHAFNLYDAEESFFLRHHQFTADMEELYATTRSLKTAGYTYGFLPDPHKPELKTVIQDGRATKLDDLPDSLKESCPDCHVMRVGFKGFAYGYIEVQGARQLIVWTVDDSHKLANPINGSAEVK